MPLRARQRETGFARGPLRTAPTGAERGPHQADGQRRMPALLPQPGSKDVARIVEGSRRARAESIGVECEDVEARLAKQIRMAVAQQKPLGCLAHRMSENQRAYGLAPGRPPQPGKRHVVGTLERDTLPIGLYRPGWPDPGNFEPAEEGLAQDTMEAAHGGYRCAETTCVSQNLPDVRPVHVLLLDLP